MRVSVLCCVLSLLPGAVAAQTRPAAPPKNHVQVDFSLEDLSRNEKTQTQTTVTLTHGVSMRSQLFVVVDSHNRFDDPDTQINAGINHVFGARKVMVSASAGFGLDVQTIATREFDVKAQVRVSEHLNPIAEVSYSTYRHDTDVAVLTLGGVLTWKALNAQAGVQFTRASVGTINEEGLGLGVKSSLRLTPKVSLVAGGNFGSEHAIAKTIREAQRAIDAWSLTGGLQFTPHPNRSLTVSYMYQDRERFYTVKALVLSGAIGF